MTDRATKNRLKCAKRSEGARAGTRPYISFSPISDMCLAHRLRPSLQRADEDLTARADVDAVFCNPIQSGGA